MPDCSKDECAKIMLANFSQYFIERPAAEIVLRPSLVGLESAVLPTGREETLELVVTSDDDSLIKGRINAAKLTREYGGTHLAGYAEIKDNGHMTLRWTPIRGIKYFD